MPKWISFILKLLVTLALFWLVAHVVDIPQAMALFTQANWWWVALAIGLMVFSTVLSGIRWKLVAIKLGLPAHIAYQKFIWLGALTSQFLPSGIGGDAVRAVGLRQYIGKGLITSILFERGIGLLVNLMITALTLPFAYAVLGNIWLFWLICSICIGGILSAGLYIFSGEKLPIKYMPRLGKWLLGLIPALKQVLFHESFMVWFLSLIIQCLGIFQTYILSLALGLDVGFLPFLILFPTLIILMLVPLSIGNWGLRESVVVVLFTTAGVTGATEAATLSILYGLCMMAGALPGIVFIYKHTL